MRSFSALAQAGVPAAGRSRVPAAGALMGLQNAPQGHWKSRARGGLWGNPKQALSRLSSCSWKSFLIQRNISHVYFWLALYFPDTRSVKSYLMPEKLLTEGVDKGVSGYEIQAAHTLPFQ